MEPEIWVDYLRKLPKRHGSGGSDGRCWNKGPNVCGRTGLQFYVRGCQGGNQEHEE